MAAPTIPTMPILAQNKQDAALAAITDIDIGGPSLLAATSFSQSKTRDADTTFFIWLAELLSEVCADMSARHTDKQTR